MKQNWSKFSTVFSLDLQESDLTLDHSRDEDYPPMVQQQSLFKPNAHGSKTCISKFSGDKMQFQEPYENTTVSQIFHLRKTTLTANQDVFITTVHSLVNSNWNYNLMVHASIITPQSISFNFAPALNKSSSWWAKLCFCRDLGRVQIQLQASKEHVQDWCLGTGPWSNLRFWLI